MRRLDSTFSTSSNKWVIYLFLIFTWGLTIKAFAEGNQRITPMYYILPPVTIILLWWLWSFKQVTLDGDTLIIRDSRREVRVPISQVKRIHKRNGKMSYVSLVFKSETEFGRCVRIFTMDDDIIAKMLLAAMEGKNAGVKINHVQRESTHIPHKKDVIVRGWTSEELSNILTDFAEMYAGRLGHDFDYAVCPDDKGSAHITFPHDIPATQFSFLINYLQYPKNYDSKARSISVIGKARLSPEVHPPVKDLIGQNAVFYIPTNDPSFDLVYVRVGNETFENSFAARRWKQVTDARIPPGIEIS